MDLTFNSKHKQSYSSHNEVILNKTITNLKYLKLK